jgi:hypothetical protein
MRCAGYRGGPICSSGQWVAAIVIVAAFQGAVSDTRAQTGPTPLPACRVAKLDEERSMLAGARRALAQLDELAALTRRQAEDAEVRLRDPGASPAVAETYRRLRSQLRDMDAQRVEFTRLLANWCEQPDQPPR